MKSGILSELEAAIHTGMSPELLRSLTASCPKSGENQLLPYEEEDGFYYYSKKDLNDYCIYLKEEWPCPDSASRAHIPEIIKSEVRRAANYRCSICTHTNNLEVAHIKSWKDSKCNDPDNLILLCPNHHTQYDYGFKLHDSLKISDIRQLKAEQVFARKFEWKAKLDPAKAALKLVATIAALQARAEKIVHADGVRALAADLVLSEESKITSANAIKDENEREAIEESKALIEEEREKLASSRSSEAATKMVNRFAAKASEYEELLESLDTYDCPHCAGRGRTGLVGDVCYYCKGNATVTKDEIDDYDPDEIDEVECPHCEGRGQIGFRNELCSYCKGSQVVSKEEAEEYDPDEIDEVDCPHCEGRGRIGFRDELCSYCKGDSYVSQAEADEYDPKELDEVECPHCEGRGRIGFRDELCSYCKGDTYVSREEAEQYNPSEIDEVECPHCEGRGRIGFNDELCSYCRGDTYVSREEADEYDSSEIDEVRCPHCQGHGQTFSGETCRYCKGDTYVTRKKRQAYIEKFGGAE